MGKQRESSGTTATIEAVGVPVAMGLTLVLVIICALFISGFVSLDVTQELANSAQFVAAAAAAIATVWLVLAVWLQRIDIRNTQFMAEQAQNTAEAALGINQVDYWFRMLESLSDEERQAISNLYETEWGRWSDMIAWDEIVADLLSHVEEVADYKDSSVEWLATVKDMVLSREEVTLFDQFIEAAFPYFMRTYEVPISRQNSGAEEQNLEVQIALIIEELGYIYRVGFFDIRDDNVLRAQKRLTSAMQPLYDQGHLKLITSSSASPSITYFIWACVYNSHSMAPDLIRRDDAYKEFPKTERSNKIASFTIRAPDGAILHSQLGGVKLNNDPRISRITQFERKD